MLNLQPYTNRKITSNWNAYFYKKNVFTDDMIRHLESMVHQNYSFSKGRTGVQEFGTETDSKETNNRDIAYIHPADHLYTM